MRKNAEYKDINSEAIGIKKPPIPFLNKGLGGKGFWENCSTGTVLMEVVDKNRFSQQRS